MPVAGIDIGAGTAKAVIMADKQIQSYSIMKIQANLVVTIQELVQDVLGKAGIKQVNLDYVIATGYGRELVAIANETVTEITCAAKGAAYLVRGLRTIIDIGAQDAKGLRVDSNGSVIDFVMNDKCAAGTGKFIEYMSMSLGIPLEQMGPLSLTSQSPASISSTCTVFAETEIISLRAQGKPEADLVAGIHRSASARTHTMMSSIGFEETIAFIGGVAKNIGMKAALEERIGTEITVPDEPQIVVAIGGALLAESRYRNRQK